MSDDDEGLGPADLFFLPEDGDPADPRPIVRRLVEELEEFAHLRQGEAVIMVVMRATTKVKAGRLVLGEMCLPRWQGSMGPLAVWLLAKACGGTLPDFILVLDATWWGGATGHQREALTHHELMHAQIAKDKEGEPKFNDEGLPQWAIEGHHLEEFRDTVRRYGAWLEDIPPFVDALREGGAL